MNRENKLLDKAILILPILPWVIIFTIPFRSLSRTGVDILMLISIILLYFLVRLTKEGKIKLWVSYISYLPFLMLSMVLGELLLSNSGNTKVIGGLLFIVYALIIFLFFFDLLIYSYKLRAIRRKKWEESNAKMLKKSNRSAKNLVAGVKTKKSVKILLFAIMSLIFIFPIALYAGYVLGEIAFYATIVIILGLLGKPMYKKYFEKATNKDLWKVINVIFVFILGFFVLTLRENYEILNNFKPSILISLVISFFAVLILYISWIFKKMGYTEIKFKKK